MTWLQKTESVYMVLLSSGLYLPAWVLVCKEGG